MSSAAVTTRSLLEISTIRSLLEKAKGSLFTKGDAQAQYELGRQYELAPPVRTHLQDKTTATEWYRRAAEQGHTAAQFELGLKYEFGRDVPIDNKTSFEWCRKAAKQGHIEAQFALGDKYNLGLGVPEDPKTASEWYRKAAEQGHTESQFTLGRMYEFGRGVPKDAKAGCEWHRRAAEQGHTESQFELGLMYELGLGITKDEKAACEWYRLAAKQGYENAKKKLEQIAERESLKKLAIPAPNVTQDPVKSSIQVPISPPPLSEIKRQIEGDELKVSQELNIAQNSVASPATIPSPAKSAMPSVDLSNVPRIAWNDLKRGDLVGNGSYGDVYKGQWQGAMVAIKELQLKTLSEPIAREFEHESDMMMQCQFHSIVRLYGICTEPGHFAMVMEYLPTSLRNRLQDGKALAWLKRLNIALEMAQGIAYLHNRKIIHRDLKSLNILLDEHERAKIGDFGLAKVKLEVGSTSTKSQKAVGSIRWRAPELFKRHATPTPASDVYSLGMLFWELASRQLPFSDAPDEVTVVSWIQAGEQEKIPDDCPKAFAEIIQSCWAAPEKRPSAFDIVTALQTAIEIEKKAAKELKENARIPAGKFWQFDVSLKPSGPLEESYALITAGKEDTKKVLEIYNLTGIPGYEIRGVKIIYNPSLSRAFFSRLELLQERSGSPAFKPTWDQENEPAWRGKIISLLEKMSAAYADPDFPGVKIFPCWHATNSDNLLSLFKTGYANLATTDLGWYGKGLYGSWEIEYPWRVYNQGTVLFNLFSCFSAYPVIDGDMKKLTGKANYKNYDAHIVPVKAEDPRDPNPFSYIPPKPGEMPTYTEFVVFESSQALPWGLIELQPTLVAAPSSKPLIYAFMTEMQQVAAAKPKEKDAEKKDQKDQKAPAKKP